MQKIAMAVHGGALPDSDFIQQHKREYDDGIREALLAAYKILENGGPAVDAVEEAGKKLEDNTVFNAGRGSSLNNKGEIQMDAAIMDGSKLAAGAVSMVKNVKNPITLARHIMTKTNHV